MSRSRVIGIFAIGLAVSLAARPSGATDWPTFRGDYARSGRTSEQITPDDELQLAWVYQSPHPPQPAWSGPAKWDSYKLIRGLKSMRNYDPVFHTTIAGGRLYFGSSLEESVHCLDTRSGTARWTFTTGGPVRIAPSYQDGKLYFGSDDGFAYCVSAEDGRLIWKFCAQPKGRKVIHDGRLISFWPVRTGVIVDEGVAYFGASMLPWKPTYLCAIDASTGEMSNNSHFVREFKDQTMEGALVASKDHLIAPQGRVPPHIYERTTGKDLGSLGGAGGSFVLLTDEQEVIHGPGSLTGELTSSSVASQTRLASFKDGHDIVVAGDTAYVLTEFSLAAIRRDGRQLRWQVPCGHSSALILAGDTLFAGGTDEIAAYSTSDGRLTWSHPIRGAAYGLAVADGALYVSTDEGQIACFRRNVGPDAAHRSLAVMREEAPATGDGWRETEPSAKRVPVTDVQDAEITHHWVFHRALLKSGTGQTPIWPLREAQIRDRAAGLKGTISGLAEVVRVGEVFALEMDGSHTCVRLEEDLRKIPLPAKAMTAETWVRIDKPCERGAIVGVQGSGEPAGKGWVLGIADNRFTFGLASEASEGMTLVRAAHELRTSQWYHVAGTYDGQQIRFFVNGRLVAGRSGIRGDIAYPSEGTCDIGVGREGDKEHFFDGMLHSVAVCNQAATAEAIRENYEASADRFYQPTRPASGPTLRFTGPQSAVVRWTTAEPTPTVLEYDLEGRAWRYEDAEPKTNHQLELTHLRRNRQYKYALLNSTDGDLRFTKDYLCDTSFNYQSPDAPERVNPFEDEAKAGLVRDVARSILQRTGCQRGLCLVLGVENGNLAYELARQSRLRVIGCDARAENVAEARRRLMEAGAYGSHVSILQVDSLSELALPGHFANLIVSETALKTGEMPAGPDEVFRLLRPDGGIAHWGQPADLLDAADVQAIERKLAVSSFPYEISAEQGWWVTLRRRELAGAGTWTHQYGDAGNTAYGGETLLGAGKIEDLTAQWIGRPGPRYQDDRNGRNSAPLAVKGRLFCQGLERILALDAYNGTILWSLETPEFMRYNVPRDCANWCADEDELFLAVLDQCWRVDAETGQIEERMSLVPGPRGDWDYEWGFVARPNYRMLVGSAVKAGTALRDFWGGFGWYDADGGPAAAKVCSDNLFAFDAQTNDLSWNHTDGLIINPTITADEGRIFFVECRNPEIIAAEERWIHAEQLWEDLYLVALDIDSGTKLYEQPLDVVPGDAVFYMALGQGRLVIVSSHQSTVKYHVYAIDAETGELLWSRDFSWMKADHGGHMSRPAILGGRLYIRPRVLDLNTGAEVEGLQMAGGGCGTYAATCNAFFFRSGNVSMWDAESSLHTSWNRLRPDCWLSTVPALGLVLSPEGGGGCSCGTWMETSIAFLPEERRRQLDSALGDATHAVGVRSLLQTIDHAQDPQVRLAAVRALASRQYSDAANEAVSTLIDLSAGRDESLAAAARATLRILSGTQVTRQLLKLLAVDTAPAQAHVEIVKCLGDRGAVEAKDQLMWAAQNADAEIRIAALAALPQVIRAVDYADLVALVDKTTTDSERRVAIQSVLTAAQRLQHTGDKTKPLISSWERASHAETRIALLELLGKLGGPGALAAVREWCEHDESSVRDAAWKTLAEWPDPGACEELLALAGATTDPHYRQLALAGAMHASNLLGDKRDAKETLRWHQDALDLAETPAQKRLVLTSLARARDAESLKLLRSLLEDPSVREDVVRAMLPVARAIGDRYQQLASEALENVRRMAVSTDAREESAKVLDHIQRFEDFVTHWQVTGPFVKPEENTEALIQISFPPEPGEPASQEWLEFAPEISPRALGIVNLAQQFSGEDRCLYLRANVFIPETRPVAMLIGSDESIRVWLDGQVVHEKVLAGSRPMVANQDRAEVTLKKGWNTIVIKTVQTEGDWQVSCRLRAPDGSKLDGLVYALPE